MAGLSAPELIALGYKVRTCSVCGHIQRKMKYGWLCTECRSRAGKRSAANKKAKSMTQRRSMTQSHDATPRENN